MKNDLLNQFNKGLLEMRELFHKTGRLEDSNTKLDEITKFLCLEIASINDPGAKIPSLGEILSSDREGVVSSLNAALLLASKSKVLMNYDGESLLGPNPKFNLAESEEALAKVLANVVLTTFNGYLREKNSAKSFEFLNEAFGHFIRDNFRQNIEDAQYMTPVEVVNFMVELGIDRLNSRGCQKGERPIICDPSCGVGSFLAHFYRVWIGKGNKVKPLLVGQDKVDRMARLSLLNLVLFGISDAKVSRGNSLYSNSPLDEFKNKCDLIITNPPFGARFSTSELATQDLSHYPFLSDFIQNSEGYIDSELLFLDKYFSLLKPGGTLLAVVPDSVISAFGQSAYLREKIQNKWKIISITELPASTFAQAGTRTKTCILEVAKIEEVNDSVILSTIKSLGFEVASKKGVPYKKQVGENELLDLLPVVVRAKDLIVKSSPSYEVLSTKPSCVSVSQKNICADGWTPSHFSSNRLAAIKKIEGLRNTSGFNVHSLDSLVTLPSLRRRGLSELKNTKCISVLHIGDFGSLNVRDFLTYVPKTAGKPCAPGDILFSKINPRIPRILIVPELPYNLTCSSEFEVMRARDGFSPFAIMLLLLSKYAQDQILSLTSGTSSSHNRIKTKELLSVKLAIPQKGTSLYARYEQAVVAFEAANRQLNASNINLQESWSVVNDVMQVK